MEDLKAGDLRIAVTAGVDGAPVELHWTGKSNDRNPGRLLAPFFHSVLDFAQERGKSVEMHFEHIDHFNSSTVTALIQLIQESRRRELSLELVYDAALKWQRLSFDGLKALAAKDSRVRLRSA